MNELTKEEQIEYLKKEIDRLQAPIQYQFMAIEKMLLYQKENMLEELWLPYLTSLQIFFNDIFKKTINGSKNK